MSKEFYEQFGGHFVGVETGTYSRQGFLSAVSATHIGIKAYDDEGKTLGFWFIPMDCITAFCSDSPALFNAEMQANSNPDNIPDDEEEESEEEEELDE